MCAWKKRKKKENLEIISWRSRNRQNKGNGSHKQQQQQILDELVEEAEIHQLEERELDEIIEEEDNTMIIAIAAGVGCLLMLTILTTVACCISRKVKDHPHWLSMHKYH